MHGITVPWIDPKLLTDEQHANQGHSNDIEVVSVGTLWQQSWSVRKDFNFSKYSSSLQYLHFLLK